MEDLKKLANSILEKGYLMSLATVDEGGPWVSDVIYVHDKDFNIYWLSQINRRHSRAILKEPRAAVTVTLTSKHGDEEVGLQIEGVAEKVEGDILEMARKHRRKRNKPLPQQEGEVLDEGESWYVLRPSKIEIIYEPLFGWGKKQIIL